MGLIPEPSQDLVTAIQQRRAIAVAGSGLSCAARAPSWEQWLLGIAAEADGTHPHDRADLAIAKAAEGTTRWGKA